MKYFILPMIFFFQFSYAVEEEITSWFNQESEKFLEIMNNSDGQNNENYDEYIKFVEKNFAVKSIAYGLIPESILAKSDKSDLKNYEVSFQNYFHRRRLNLWNHLQKLFHHYCNDFRDLLLLHDYFPQIYK